MKAFNDEEVERLFTELGEYGYVFPMCLRWHVDDIKAKAENAEYDVNDKTNEELATILEGIIDENEQSICELINGFIYDDMPWDPAEPQPEYEQ